jgi:hypothetical protein
MRKSIWLFAVLIAVAGPSTLAGEVNLSYVDLVKRLTDLEYLATVPTPGDQCGLWSSYDRASRYDAATGSYVDWAANKDGGGFIRKEGDEMVLAEMSGPGCIWRTWSAQPRAGHVRIYLDGSTNPVVDLPFSGYFDGTHAPFNRPALVNEVSEGWNNYTPIPYQKSCKIVADPGWGRFFHFNYESFPPGTRVPTFTGHLTAEESDALDQANSILLHCGADPAGIRPGQQTLTNAISVAGHSTSVLARLSGPAAIVGIRIKLDRLPAHPDDYEWLRGLALQINWDGETNASVWAPFGDFFGTAPGANPYTSLPLGLTRDGWWYCYWYMPFGREAVVRLINDNAQAQSLSLELTTAPLSRPIEQLERFHAKWHRDAFPPADPGRAIDWTLVTTTGSGRYVGTMLHIWNPRPGWWGEGDEKFFVDGEKFPSTFGTGSEDYFGYAWGCPKLFQNAYHDQTHNDGDNRGHISVNRWHISDAVPFQKSFDGNLEKYFSNERPTIFAAVAYWYLSADGEDPYQSVPLDQRIGYWTPIETFKVNGAIEGESLTVLGETGGTIQNEPMFGFAGQWSNDHQLWWSGAHPGDKLHLALPVAAAGQFKISFQMTKAPDYGIVQFYLDGHKLGSTVDLYHPSVVAPGEMELGREQLTAGTHTLDVEIIGANPKAIPGYMFGLDYVKLEPVN